MQHKCKFEKHRNKRNRRHMSYKCHGCFLVIVVRKRTIHRMLTDKYKGRVPRKHLVVTQYDDTKDPGYAEYAWNQLFGYEAVHAA